MFAKFLIGIMLLDVLIMIIQNFLSVVKLSITEEPNKNILSVLYFIIAIGAVYAIIEYLKIINIF